MAILEPEGRIKYSLVLNAFYNNNVVDFETQHNYAITRPNNYFAQITAISAGAVSFENLQSSH